MAKTAKMNIMAAMTNGAYIHSAIIPQKMIIAAMTESAISIVYPFLLLSKSHAIYPLTLKGFALGSSSAVASWNPASYPAL